MLLALQAVDYGVLALYLAAMLAVGAYFSREQHTSQDFFLAGRSMNWLPLGLSIMATLMSALTYTGVPGETYFVGLKPLLLPLCIWLTLPVMLVLFLPLYHNLRLFSIYEYLELRYDHRVRLAASVVFVLWRLLWLGGVLYAPCKVLIVAAGLPISEPLLLATLGLVGTIYTFLGGMKAVIWTDVIQATVMAGGLLLIIVGVWLHLDGGPAAVWSTAQELGRTQVFDFQFSWTEQWSFWAMAPHFTLAMLSFYIADQITAQRFLTGKSLAAVRRSFVLNCVSVSVMYPGLIYAGVALLAFYQLQPDELRPRWVVNVDGATGHSVTRPETRRPLLDPRTGQPRVSLLTDEPLTDPTSGEPYLAWHEPLDVDTIDRLVAEGRVLDPNTKEPVTDAATLLSADGARLDPVRLATRKPPEQGAEIVVNRQAKDELMPRFLVERLPLGVAGLILAALFAASMSSMDSGLSSIATLLIVDFHRRLGIGRRWFATLLGKPVERLSDVDELRLGRPLVLVIGVLATICSMFIGLVGDIFQIMVAVINTFGGPLLAIFLLGVLTRRTTAAGALAALVGGTLFTVWLMAANTYTALAWAWPFPGRLGSVWPLVFGVAFSLALGYGVSWLAGRPRTKDELRGLVWGLGELGRRGPDEASIAIDVPDANSPRGSRWR